MNREEVRELLPIMQAFAEGKNIQYFSFEKIWTDVVTPSFVSSSKWRVKPEPREFYLCNRCTSGTWIAHETYDEAAETTRENATIIKVREVIES